MGGVSIYSSLCCLLQPFSVCILELTAAIIPHPKWGVHFVNNSLRIQKKAGCLWSYIITGQPDTGGVGEGGDVFFLYREAGGGGEQGGRLIHKLKRMLQSTLGRQAGRRKCWKRTA